MDDKLEKYIKSHRDDLDDKIPRKDIWSSIEGELGNDSNQVRMIKPVVYWRAAAVILLMVSTWLVFDKVSQDTTTNNTIAEVVEQEVNPQLLEAESYYISLIDQKREEISMISKQFEFGDEFVYEIDRLDSVYAVLKQDMANGNEENLVDAMILNLQLRIEILNQQLSIIQSIENSQQDETIIL